MKKLCSKESIPMEARLMSEVEIYDTISDGRGKVLLEGFPDIGLVGAIAVSFLVEKLGLEEVGYIDSELLPPVVAIHNTKVRDLIRIYEGSKVVALFSEIPIPVPLVKSLSKAIIEWAERKQLEHMICLTGLAEPNRLDIDSPRVFVVASNSGFAQYLAEATGAEAMKDGYIAGINAELIKEGARKRRDVGVILAQSHYNYPDPGAAAQLILRLPKLIGEEIDVKPLLESAERIRMQMRDLMRRTAETMGTMQKSKELELPPVYL